jgi:adenylate cyclase
VAEDGDAVEIDAFLKSLGATDDQVTDAWADRHVARLAGDLVFAQGATLTARDLASRSGTSVGDVLSIWRTLGVVVPDEDHPMFAEGDAELTGFFVGSNPVSPHGDELLRVLGSSLARVAEAAVSVYVQTQEPAYDSPEPDLLAWAREQAAVSAAALRLGDSMGSVFAHHMRDAIDRQRLAQEDVSDPSLHRLAVGFVDLVGFTPLTLHTSPASLLELVGTFEDRAFGVASSHHGRIVKHIGDEVMFVAPSAASGCAIAWDITTSLGSGIEPRGGVCFGDVISRHGDYYGPVVNMASRLADLAIPREVLVDAATVRSAKGAFEFRPAGNRLLKGFEDPVEVHSIGAVLAG